MSETFSRVEVITGVARRRRFAVEQKLSVVDVQLKVVGASQEDTAGGLPRAVRVKPKRASRWLRPWATNRLQAGISAKPEMFTTIGSCQMFRITATLNIPLEVWQVNEPSAIYRQKLLEIADAAVLGPPNVPDAETEAVTCLEDALVALDAAISSVREQVGDAAARDLVNTVYDLSTSAEHAV